MSRVQCFALGAVVLSGCGEPLVPPELIVNNRVLGARVEVTDDPTAAWPEPNERGTVRWLTASPEGAPALGWTASLCAAEAVSRGLPICAAPSFTTVTSEGTTDDEPVLEFETPSRAGLQGASQLAVMAAFCESGTPSVAVSGVDVTTTRCPEPKEQPLFATFGIQVALDGATNENPEFEAVAVKLDGDNWPAWTEGSEEAPDCSTAELPVHRVPADGKTHQIELTVPSALSERIAGLSVHSSAREILQLSHFVTAGELERVYSTVALGATEGKVVVTWTAPDSVKRQGELMRLYMVLRDGRGGVSWSRRALCITW